MAEVAAKARKDFYETRALICALRRQGKIRVEGGEWRPVPYRNSTPRRRYVVRYRVDHAYKPVHSEGIFAHPEGSDVSVEG